MPIIDFIKAYKYKFGQAICLIIALAIIYISVQISMGALSGTAPNLASHVLSFFAVILLVALAVYCKYKDARQTYRK